MVLIVVENIIRYVLDIKEIKIVDILFCKDKLICFRSGVFVIDFIRNIVRLSGKINISCWLLVILF